MDPASHIEVSNHKHTPFSDKLSQKVLDSLRSLNRSLNAMENNVAVIEHNLDSDDEFLQEAEGIRSQSGQNGFVPSWQLRRELVLQGLESSEDETTEDGDFDFDSPRRTALLRSPPVATRIMGADQEARDTATSSALREVLIKLLRHSSGSGVELDETLSEDLKRVLGTDPETAIKASEAKLPDRRAKAQAPPKALGGSQRGGRGVSFSGGSSQHSMNGNANSTTTPKHQNQPPTLSEEEEDARQEGKQKEKPALSVAEGKLATPIIALPDSLSERDPAGSESFPSPSAEEEELALETTQKDSEANASSNGAPASASAPQDQDQGEGNEGSKKAEEEDAVAVAIQHLPPAPTPQGPIVPGPTSEPLDDDKSPPAAALHPQPPAPLPQGEPKAHVEVPLGVEFGYTELPPLTVDPPKPPGEEELQEDEWRDDYDPGYVLVQISEDEFLALEEEAAEAAQRTALAKQIRDQLTTWQKENQHLGKPKDPTASQGLEEDLAAAEAVLASQAGLIGHEEGFGEDGSNQDPSGTSPTESNISGLTGPEGLTTPGYQTTGDTSPCKEDVSSRAPAIDAAPAKVAPPGEDDTNKLAPGLEFFDLKVIYQKGRTGFEESKHFNPPLNEIVAGRYQVREFLGQAAFSTALQCVDLKSDGERPKHVCLKVIKNNKDFFDQSLDEIKLLKYINSSGKPDRYHVLQMFDFFYYKEHLIIVSELLRENLYEFGKYIRDNNEEPYFTIPRLQKIMRQCLEALAFINRLNLIHCDIKPENIVIKSYSRVEIKMIDFGSSCYTTDHLTSYIQSRSYRAPEVVLGLPYGQRIDVWSLGCVLAEMLTGYVLFQNDSIQTMLARIQGVLEPFPEHMLEHGRDVPKYFTSNNLLYERIEDGEGSANGFILIYPKKTTLRHRLHTRDHLFLDFVTKALAIDPAKRPTAEEALRHPWILEGLKLTPEEIAYCPT